MVESSLELCADRATDGAVPFLGFGDEDPTGEGVDVTHKYVVLKLDE